MSLTDPTKATLKSAMKGHAEMLKARAEALSAMADSLDEMTEEKFMLSLGDQYSGPGFVRQLQEEVAKASEVRPSDIFPFTHTLNTLFSKAQRASALSERK